MSFRDIATRVGLVGITALTGLAVADTVYHVNRSVKRGTEMREFLPNSTNASIRDSLRTGDVLVFKRKLWSYNPLKVATIYFSRKLFNSDYDYMGVIVVDPQDGVPYVLEYAHHGPRLEAFEQRVLHADDDEIILRKLKKSCEPERVREASVFVRQFLLKAPQAGRIPICWNVAKGSLGLRTPYTDSPLPHIAAAIDYQQQVNEALKHPEQRDSQRFVEILRTKQMREVAEALEKENRIKEWREEKRQERFFSPGRVSPTTELSVEVLKRLGVLWVPTMAPLHPALRANKNNEKSSTTTTTSSSTTSTTASSSTTSTSMTSSSTSTTTTMASSSATASSVLGSEFSPCAWLAGDPRSLHGPHYDNSNVVILSPDHRLEYTVYSY